MLVSSRGSSTLSLESERVNTSRTQQIVRSGEGGEGGLQTSAGGEGGGGGGEEGREEGESERCTETNLTTTSTDASRDVMNAFVTCRGAVDVLLWIRHLCPAPRPMMAYALSFLNLPTNGGDGHGCT